jgi:LysM repeat protein
MRLAVLLLTLAPAFGVTGCATSGRPTETTHSTQAETDAQLNAVALASIQANAASGGYVIRAGDTAVRIAQLFGMTLADLAASNPDVKWNELRVGQLIKIESGKEPNQSPQPTQAFGPHG